MFFILFWSCFILVLILFLFSLSILFFYFYVHFSDLIMFLYHSFVIYVHALTQFHFYVLIITYLFSFLCSYFIQVFDLYFILFYSMFLFICSHFIHEQKCPKNAQNKLEDNHHKRSPQKMWKTPKKSKIKGPKSTENT
jgi:ABC-type transport system involved in multi-copper enzyme maturation permease subunit